MEIKEKILKFQEGRAISKKDYNEAKAAYDLALKDLEADTTIDEKVKEARKDKAAKWLESVANDSVANPGTNRHQRLRGAQGYRIGKQIIEGTDNAASIVQPMTDKIFPTRIGDQARVSNIYGEFDKLNKNVGASQTHETSHANTGTGAGTFRFNWKKGLNAIAKPINATFQLRIIDYASALKRNISEALKSGKTVVGGLNNMGDYVELLLQVIDGALTNPEGAYNALVGIAGNFDKDGTHFHAWFDDYLPQNSVEEKSRLKWKDDGYTFIDNYKSDNEELNNLISQNYYVAEKGGRKYLIKKDYSGLADSKFKINSNNTQDTFGHGYYIGTDGGFFGGNLLDEAADNPYRELIDKHIKENIFNKNSDRWYYLRASETSDDALLFNRLTDYSEQEDDLINTFSKDLDQKAIVDVSAYFDGTPAIATFEDNNVKNHIDKLGNIKLDNTATLYIKGVGKVKFSDLNSKNLSLNFDNDLMYGNVGKFTSNKSTYDSWRDLTSAERAEDLNGASDGYNWWWDWSSNIVNPITGEELDTNRDILGNTSRAKDGNNVDTVGRLMLTVLALGPDGFKTDDDKKDAKKILNRIINNPWVAAKIMYDCINRGGLNNLDKDTLNLLYDAWNKFNIHYKPKVSSAISSIPEEKLGGILKAASGLAVNSLGQSTTRDVRNKLQKDSDEKFKDIDALKARADAEGYSMAKQDSIESGWSKSDTLRATALATDVVGLIGALTGAATGGVGSAVAVGSGFASMVLDAIADFTDDKVSAGQAWKNIGVNTGLALGAAFGAKAPKLIKGVMKILPKAMMAIGTAGIVLDPEVLKTASKIAAGKSLNVNDWKNINIILRTAVGMGTMHAAKRGADKAVKEFDTKLNKALKEQVALNADENSVTIKSSDGKTSKTISKEVFDDVKTKLETSPDDAVKALKDAGLTDAEVNSLISESENSRGYNPFKKEFWKPGTKKEITLATEEDLAKNIPDDIKADIYKTLYTDATKNTDNGKLRGNNWFTKTIGALDTATEKATFGLIKQQNYALNAMSGALKMTPQEIENWIAKNLSAIDSFDLLKLNVSKYQKSMKGAMDNAKANSDASNQRVAAKKATLELAKIKAKKALKDVDDFKAKLANIDKQLSELKIHENGQKVHDLKVLRDQIATEMYAKMQAVNDIVSKMGTKSMTGTVRLLNIENKVLQIELAEKQLADFMLANPTLFKKDGTLRAGVKNKEAIRVTSELNKAKKALTKKEKSLYDVYTQVDTERANYEQTYNDAMDAVAKGQASYDLLRIREADLKRRKQRLKSSGNLAQLEAISKTANDAKEVAETEVGKAEFLLRKAYKLNANNLAAERIKSLSKQKLTLGSTRKEVQLLDTNASPITIKAGSKVKSYAHLRNKDLAKEVAKASNKNSVELSAEEARKLVKSGNRDNIRGGFYNLKTGKVTLFNKGGDINSKYSYLRK